MYELEVTQNRDFDVDLTPEIREAFEGGEVVYQAISVLQWEEHCTECAMPSCYKSCDLYIPRKDGKCRRFVNGILPVYGFSNYQGYVVKIEFKKWASLMATGRLDIANLSKVKNLEKRLGRAELFASVIPDGNLSLFGRRGISSRFVRRLKRLQKQKLLRSEKIEQNPDYFLIEIYNPYFSPVDLTFVIRAFQGNKNQTPYQNKLHISSGFNKIKLPYDEIYQFIDPSEEHFVSFVPNLDTEQESIVLYFGVLGFVKEKINKNIIGNIKFVKVAVWDLDNTVWDGILVENGIGNVKLKENMKYIMEELDQRGIINSVVSKNNYEDAMRQLDGFALSQLVVFPHISWQPKSQEIQSLIKEFNVGADTIAFIDDSPFEREEVKASNPAVRVYDAADYQTILNLPEFNPEISSESSRRREFYIGQKRREFAHSSFNGDYLDFVKSCNIRLAISRVEENKIDRIQELVQRTNQMNFSGNRYDRSEIEKFVLDAAYDAFCIECEDKFGDYGTVGFCLVQNQLPRLKDLMFSCRIQSKRVEHAFLSWLLCLYQDLGFKEFSALYNKTVKNAPAGRVFEDLGFSINENKGDFFLYGYDLTKKIADDKIIDIAFNDESR